LRCSLAKLQSHIFRQPPTEQAVRETTDTLLEVKARVIAYGDNASTIDELIAATRASPLTDTVYEMDYTFGRPMHIRAGNAIRELLVTYRSDNSIHNTLVSRGLIPDALIRIRNGREQWTVIVDGNADPQSRLDEVRQQMDAEITVCGTGKTVCTFVDIDGELTERQREVFETARSHGYYEWPRHTTAAELADTLEISKATVLEYLRKAESKLLDP
jgi:predicted DNA binding protein